MNADSSPLKADASVVTVTLNTTVDRTLEVPGFQVGTTRKAKLLGRVPSGKGINVSRCLAQLGIPSRALGFVGQIELSLYEDSLADTGVTLDLIPVPGWTRTNTTILDSVWGTETHLREPGFEIMRKELDALHRKLAQASAPGKLFVFSGSLPPAVSSHQFLQLVQVAQEKGGRVVVDTSGAALKEALKSLPLLVKPNELELRELTDRRLTDTGQIILAARQLLSAGTYVLVSRGENGAMLICADGAWQADVKLETTELRNSVGAGDALLAGLLTAWLKQGSPPDALRYATAIAASCVCTYTAGQLAMDMIPELLSRAQIEALS